MSVLAVGSLTPILREVEAGLTMPIPERVRLLRERESDLEELTARFVADGMSVEEVLLRARDALVPDQRSRRELKKLHAALYREMTRHVAGDRL